MPAFVDSFNSALESFNHLNVVLAGLPHEKNLSSAELNSFSTAIRVAKASAHPKAKVGCLIVEKSRVIATGVNSLRTHPQAAKWKAMSLSLCAEMDAMLEAQRQGFEPKKTSVVVARVNRKGIPRTSYPCSACMAAMLHLGITKIICLGWDGAPTSIRMEL